MSSPLEARSLCVAAALAASVFACAPTVIQDPAADGGGGSGQSGGGEVASDGGGPSTTSPCQANCAANSGCPDWGSETDCVASCEELLAALGACADEYEALMACYATDLGPECTVEGVCVAEQQAYKACAFPPFTCYAGECDFGDASCTCTGECVAQNDVRGWSYTLTQSCVFDGESVICQCSEAGFGDLGSCEDPALACSETGCCAAMLEACLPGC